MTGLKGHYWRREEKGHGETRNTGRKKVEKEGGQKGTDWDCGSGIKLPICILQKRQLELERNLTEASTDMKR